MNLKVFALLCIVLVVVLMMDEAEGRCRRRCRVRCRMSCRFRHGRLRCKPRCGLRCSLSCGRRDEAEPMAVDDENDSSMTLPNNFSDYDEDKDGKISIDEFKNVVPVDNNDAFSALDKNEDSFLNCEEFKSSLDFGDRQPSC